MQVYTVNCCLINVIHVVDLHKSWNRHMKLHSNKTVVCPKCDKVCERQDRFYSHYRGIHAKGYTVKCGEHYQRPGTHARHQDSCSKCKSIIAMEQEHWAEKESLSLSPVQRWKMSRKWRWKMHKKHCKTLKREYSVKSKALWTWRKISRDKPCFSFYYLLKITLVKIWSNLSMDTGYKFSVITYSENCIFLIVKPNVQEPNLADSGSFMECIHLLRV